MHVFLCGRHSSQTVFTFLHRAKGTLFCRVKTDGESRPISAMKSHSSTSLKYHLINWRYSNYQYLNRCMESQKIRISIVNYTNTIPFVWGLKNSGIIGKIDLQEDIPSICARKLISDE